MRRYPWDRALLAGPIVLAACVSLAACSSLVDASDYAVADAGSDSTLDGPPSTDDAAGSADEAARDSLDGRPDATVDARAAGDASDGRAPADADGGHAETGSDAAAEAEAAAAAAVDAADAGEADAVLGPVADAESDAEDASAPLCGMSLPTGQAAFQQMVLACVLAVSCDPSTFDSNISKCITDGFLSSSPYYSCLANIQDCGGFYRCWGERISTVADCPSSAPAVRCDTANNLAIDCNLASVKNCALYGGTCGTYTDSALDTKAGCIVAPSCTETDGLPHCTANGHSLYTCQGGVGFGFDCTSGDATCNDFDDAGARCFLDGPACDGAGYSCDAGALEFCSPETHRLSQTYGCAADGFSCSSSSDGVSGTCLAPGCTSLGSCVESCGADKKTLTVCVGGVPATIDCSAVGAGFTGCAMFTVAGTAYGYCL